EIHHRAVTYRRTPLLWGNDLAVAPGQLAGIIGPNGAGKSPLINACMGLLPVAGGWTRVFGKPLRDTPGRVGYVPQRESVDWDFPVSRSEERRGGRGRGGRGGAVRGQTEVE